MHISGSHLVVEDSVLLDGAVRDELLVNDRQDVVDVGQQLFLQLCILNVGCAQGRGIPETRSNTALFS